MRCIGWIGLAATVAAVPLLLFGAVAPPPPSLDVVVGGGGSHLLLLGAIERVYAVCAGAWRSAGLAQRALAAWLVAEGCFFAACNLIARRMSAFDAAPDGQGRTHARVARGGVAADPRRPTQSSKAFARSWFKPPRATLRGRARSAVSAPRLRLRPHRGRAPAEPRRVEYDDLALGDMMHFLAHGLYEKALNRLTPAELVELRGHVASLERAAGQPLARPDRPADATPHLRPMSTNADAVVWLHRPLLYYGISHGLIGGVLTPVALGAKGFAKRSHDGLDYYIHEGGGRGGRRRGARHATVFIHGVG